MRFLQRVVEGQDVLRLKMKRVGADVILLYRLIYEPIPGPVGFNISYSLTVTRIDRGGCRRYVEKISDISRSKNEALRIFTLVSRGTVFPGDAAEIISDLISI